MTYRIGWRSLRAAAPSLTVNQAKRYARLLGGPMHDHVCTSYSDQLNRRRAAAFIATLLHESGEFYYREELASGVLSMSAFQFSAFPYCFDRV